MIRRFALTTLLLALPALAQQPPPNPEGDPMSPQQKCQMKCAESATPCLMACTKGNPNESMKPENKGKTMACTRKCTEAQGPCMKACDKKAR